MNIEQDIKAVLEDSADPALLSDAAGRILWRNREAGRRFSALGENSTLSAVLPQAAIEKILATTHFSTLEVECKGTANAPLPQTAIVLDVSGRDLRSTSLLLVFKSAPAGRAGAAKREEFLATAAHDLKNPLGAIFGFADALLDSASAGNLTTRQLEVLARIRATAQRCTDLVKNYQMLSALQAGYVRRPITLCNLNAVVQDIVENSWREGPGVPALETRLTPEEVPICAERIMLDRIFSNLFSNALRYTPPTGKILVETSRQGNQALLKVANTPAFIRPEDQNQIFEKHVRAKSSVGTAGSGLGLYIVKQIVTLLAGEVELRSTEEEGTTFSVRLPIGQESQCLPFTP